MKKLYFFVVLLFFVMPSYTSTEETSIDFFDRSYIFEKDPNTVRALNRIGSMKIFEFEDGNVCITIDEKFDKNNKGYEKEIWKMRDSLGQPCTSILIIKKQVFENGQVQSIFKPVITISGLKPLIRYTKLHQEVSNFESNLPSIKTE